MVNIFAGLKLIKNMAEELALLIRLAKEAGMEGPDLAWKRGKRKTERV